MGCSICLDVYGEDNEKGTQPVALPCGHIFHRGCCQAWLKRCRVNNDVVCCPLCKTQLGAAHPLRLWPSEFSDLDTYLNKKNECVEKQRSGDREGQPSRVTSASAALDRHMTRDDQAKLLGGLLDFRQHLSAYVMAVNNVNVHSAVALKQPAFSLLSTMAQDGEAQEELETSVNALNTAMTVFNDAVASIEHLRNDTELKHAQASRYYNDSKQMQASYKKHMETKVQEEKRMLDEAERIRRLKLHHQKELQAVDREREAFRNERRLHEQEVHTKLAEASRVKTESMQAIAEKCGEAETKVNQIKEYMQEQENLRLAAEEKYREATRKSNWLADRNKILSRKLAAAREEGKRNAQVSSSRQSPFEATTREAKGKAREDVDDDAKSHASHDAAEVADQLEVLSRSVPRLAPASGMQPADPVVIEDDDLDAELSDGDYPMPQFGARQYIMPAVNRLTMSRTNSDTGRPVMPLSTSHISLNDDDEEDNDDEGAVEFITKKRQRSHDESAEGQDDSGSSSPSRLSARQFMPGPVADRAARPRIPSLGPVLRSPSGLNASLPSNDTLTERVLRGSVRTGPRRRIR